MSSWLVPVIIAVVVVDIIVMWWIFTQRRIESLGGLTFLEFQKLSSKATVMIKDHMRTNYSGEASELPDVLPDLLSRMNSHALSNGIMLERGKLKLVVGKLIAMQQIAEPAEVEEALKKVA